LILSGLGQIKNFAVEVGELKSVFIRWALLVLACIVPLSLASAFGQTVTVSPTSLSFGNQVLGTSSSVKKVTLKNAQSTSISVSSIISNLADFTRSTSCSTTLTAGSSCTISVTFTPTALGLRSGTLSVNDTGAGSPQTVPISATGTGQNAALAIDNRFFTCANGVCDIGAGHNVFVNNFFSTSFLASGGTEPYTWSGQVPAGLTLRSSGLLLGAPSVKGTSTFTVTVTDANGATATGTFSLTVTDPPPPTPPGCQTGGTLKESLSGPAFNGRTPSGQATADETKFSGCGGFSLLSVQVKDVNLPDGTQLWVTLDFGPVGTITLRGGSGTTATYNMGFFAVSRDAIRVYSALPDISTSQQILIGGAFQ